jgi:rhamnulokinase
MGKIQKQVGFSCTVVLPATHDTGSAFLAVPAKDDNAITLSSGTWSLLGVENVEPITTEQSRILNFTNEGGYDYRFRYLKNIMGLWMIQSIRRNLNKVYSFAQLEQMAKESADFPSVVDVNDQAFFAPDNMMDAVKETCRKTGQQVPQTVGEIMQCVYQSLSISYANAIKGLEDITQKKYTRIHIVGGGSKDGYLNSLTAKKTGLSVFAGPEEGTALGNLMAQMIRAGEFSDLFAARKAIHNSFNILNYT